VAFDAEESGCRGSQEFISSHLGPHLRATGAKSQGAFILDTILNFDSRKKSQKFSKVSPYIDKLANFYRKSKNSFNFPAVHNKHENKLCFCALCNGILGLVGEYFSILNGHSKKKNVIGFGPESEKIWNSLYGEFDILFS